MPATAKPRRTRRLRPGLYEVTATDGVWTVEERRVDQGYGGGWAWFATRDDLALDPMPTLRDVKEALR